MREHKVDLIFYTIPQILPVRLGVFYIRFRALEKILEEIGKDFDNGFVQRQRGYLFCDVLPCSYFGTEM